MAETDKFGFRARRYPVGLVTPVIPRRPVLRMIFNHLPRPGEMIVETMSIEAIFKKICVKEEWLVDLAEKGSLETNLRKFKDRWSNVAFIEKGGGIREVDGDIWEVKKGKDGRIEITIIQNDGLGNHTAKVKMPDEANIEIVLQATDKTGQKAVLIKDKDGGGVVIW